VLSPIHATCPAHLFLLDLIMRIIFGEEYRSLSSSLCSFLHSPVNSSLLPPNILLSTLFSKTIILSSSLNVSDQVTHPYKTTCNSHILPTGVKDFLPVLKLGALKTLPFLRAQIKLHFRACRERHMAFRKSATPNYVTEYIICRTEKLRSSGLLRSQQWDR